MGKVRRWLCLVILGLFFFMIIVDGSIVTIAIPVLAQAFHVGTAQANLIIGVYLIVISALLLPFGQLGNRFGRIRLFQFGMIVFLLGSWFSGSA
jgi:MFS family permease